MMSTRRGSIARHLIEAISVLACTACLQGCQKNNPAKTPSTTDGTSVSPADSSKANQDVQSLSSLDALYDALAARVNQRVGGAPSDDFLVTPIPFGEWGVGTVLESTRAVPVTFSKCTPPDGDPEVQTLPAPTLFSSYSMSRDIGVSAGLDEGVLKGLADANAKADFSQTVALDIADAETKMWSNVGFNQVLKSDACRGVLEPGMTYRLVRGLVLGRRQFEFSVKNTGSGAVNVPNIANFTINVGGNGSTVTVSDATTSGFLAVVSQFTVAANPTAATALVKPTETASPDPSGSAGTIFVQGDADDSPEHGRSVIAALTAARIKVAPSIEKLAAAKLPKQAQVRYFRPEDKAKAEGVLATLKDRYPDAKLVPLRLPSPPGQVEVWLPRVETSAAGGSPAVGAAGATPAGGATGGSVGAGAGGARGGAAAAAAAGAAVTRERTAAERAAAERVRPQR